MNISTWMIIHFFFLTIARLILTRPLYGCLLILSCCCCSLDSDFSSSHDLLSSKLWTLCTTGKIELVYQNIWKSIVNFSFLSMWMCAGKFWFAKNSSNAIRIFWKITDKGIINISCKWRETFHETFLDCWVRWKIGKFKGEDEEILLV